MNILHLLSQFLITFGWALTAAISMGVSLSIVIKIFDWISPIDEWEEIKKGNMSMAVMLAALIIGSSFVIGLTLMA